MKYLWIAFFLLGLGACAFEAPPPSKIPLQVASSDLQFTVEEREEANHYAVQLKWGSAPEAEGLVVQREDKSQLTATQTFSLPEGSHEFVDENAQGGADYDYRVMTRSGSMIAATSVRIPRDLVLTGGPLSSVGREINRLYLARGAHLFTQGQDVSLRIGTLIADEATIETFAEGQTAPLARAGRSGGRLKIESERGLGRLRVIMRGENGGQGESGAQGQEGAQGAHGTDASPKTSVALWKNSPLESADRCHALPGHGGRGEDGHPGAPGQAGARGGDSGWALIQIQDAEQLLLQLETFPGRGGLGGEGGSGGRGGAGGEPGVFALALACQERGQCVPNDPQWCARDRGNPGAPGAPGSSGAAGPVGPEGQRQTPCVRLGISGPASCPL